MEWGCLVLIGSMTQLKGGRLLSSANCLRTETGIPINDLVVVIIINRRRRRSFLILRKLFLDEEDSLLSTFFGSYHICVVGCLTLEKFYTSSTSEYFLLHFWIVNDGIRVLNESSYEYVGDVEKGQIGN